MHVPAEYTVVLSEAEVACEHPQRPREAIAWADLADVLVVTIVEAPWPADPWLFLADAARATTCSVPWGAQGFDALLTRLRTLPGFDDARCQATLAAHATTSAVCWVRPDEGLGVRGQGLEIAG